jgi:lipoate-protein ligase A
MVVQTYVTNAKLSDIYVSGSAYKIVKDRAYHHGTMLISSQLGTLGDVLHVSKVRVIPLSHTALAQKY